MDLGSITFGPTKSPEEIARWQSLQTSMQSISTADLSSRLCNCIGPQGGEKFCPCALAAEMAKAQRMLEDGVTIAGRKYRLVPVA